MELEGDNFDGKIYMSTWSISSHFLTTQRVKNTRLKTQHQTTKPNKTRQIQTKQNNKKTNQTKYKTIQNQSKCLKKHKLPTKIPHLQFHPFYPRHCHHLKCDLTNCNGLRRHMATKQGKKWIVECWVFLGDDDCKS